MATSAEVQPLRGRPEAPKATLKQRFSNFAQHISVEPAGVLFLAASMFAAVCTQTLQLEKACRVNLDLDDAICTSLRNQNSHNNTEFEKLVQRYVATRLAWRSAIQSIVPCLILLFVGAWSDLTGRRTVLIAFPVVGEIMQCISNIINVVFFNELPVEVLIFFDAFFPAIMGGWSTLFLGLFSYIGDITTVENRTHRLGFVHFCSFVGIPIGLGLSGIALKKFGYYAVYGTSLTVHLVNLIYISIKLKDPERRKEQKMHDGHGVSYFIRTFFDFSNVKETIRVVFKKGPNKRRLRMCVLLSIVSILFGPIYGEISIMYMSTRYRFGWDEMKFSMFQTYNFFTHTLGTVFSLLVFSKKLQWHDSVLGIISTLSKIAASFIYCFATTPQIFYFDWLFNDNNAHVYLEQTRLAPLVEILNGTSLLAMRSIISKFVTSDELGKVNSIFGLTENLMPLIYVPLYTSVYTATIEVLPGAVFLMGATMTTPAVVVFFWLFYEHRKGARRLKEPSNTATPLKGTADILESK